MSMKEGVRHRLTWIGAVFVPVAAFFWVGRSIQWVADDHCTASWLQTYGPRAGRRMGTTQLLARPEPMARKVCRVVLGCQKRPKVASAAHARQLGPAPTRRTARAARSDAAFNPSVITVRPGLLTNQLMRPAANASPAPVGSTTTV
jgi:hypothetical protein